MTQTMTIPDEYRTPFRQLLKSIPAELQNDERVQRTTLLYLKLGGVSLARQHLKLIKKQHLEEQEKERLRLLEESMADNPGHDTETDETEDDDEDI